MGSEFPEWAMEEARVALISHPGKSDPMLERVARALVAEEAEREETARRTRVAEIETEYRVLPSTPSKG